MVYRICDGFRHFENDWWQPNNNTRGGRQQKGRWEKRGQEVGEGGEGGGSWVTEGWEVGEEKFYFPCQEEGERDKWWKWSFKKQELRKSIIDNKNTEKWILVQICFSFYVFKRKEVGGVRKGSRRWERVTPGPPPHTSIFSPIAIESGKRGWL